MPTSNDTPPSGLGRSGELIRLRRSLIRLQDETRLLRRDLLLRKYNPAQARVPAGNTGGGRWTSGGDGGSVRNPAAGGGGDSLGGGGDGLAEFGSGDGFAVDDTGQEAWASYDEGWSDDGSIFERDIVNRDGSTIQSEYAASREAGWDERHTVTLSDGSKTVFETSGSVQTIRDGEVISRAVWTPDGPEPIADIVEARWRRGSRSGGSTWSAAGDKLFNWLNTFGNASGLQTVLGFRANDYQPGAVGSFDVSFVAQVARIDVERACPSMPKIQDMLDQAARDAGPSSTFQSMQKYGTDVHLRMKRSIDAWGNPNVVAERSYFKERRETGEQAYGTAGTKRFDIHERVSDGTRCLYDIKTGRALSRSQSDTLADAAMRIEGDVSRLLVIELRPRS
ncbi:hypothetical protein [Bosea lathyri]|uniref:Uncharacterized protein n=1 Tax=Bosea lathyri TaxID=1036778 RepID=A0A1H5ZE49_9HYPH|nr:hypothetical protein [Bosea lathyri]SEG34728.1 hypothetical protein SAMN04488115_104398 [Bosea lathyri]